MENLLDVVDVVGKAVEKYNGEKRYVSTGALAEDIIDDSKCEYYTYDKKPSRANLQVSEGDIIFAKMQGTKKTLIIDKDSSQNVFSTGFCALKPKNNKITTKCLYYLISSEIFLKNKDKNCSGATQKAITNEGLSKICIKLPQVEVQNKICNYLDRINNLNKKYRKQIAFFDILIKARFVEMFGDLTINSKKWVVEKLSNICEITRGGSPRPINSYLGGDVPWIKISDASKDDTIYINSTKEHIIKEGISKSRFIKKGSLIFANCGVSLGFCRIINIDGCIHDGWLAFSNVDKKINKVFLLHTINQLTNYFRTIAPGGTQPNLNIEIMGNYKQIIPPIELQEHFIDFVRHVDKLKFDVQKSLEKTQMLFDSLMQEYFG